MTGGAAESVDGSAGPLAGNPNIKFLEETEYDMGCPVDVGSVGLQIQICVDYWEINAINLGPVALPMYVFEAAVGLMVLRYLMKA
jgi:hypothetical protein